MALSEKCIYCGSEFDPTQGEGDHVIPSQLGEFLGGLPFRRICRDCNSLIGHHEQQLVQSGPEGIFRRLIQPNSKRLKKRGIGATVGAMGAPPPKHMVTLEDHLALVEPIDERSQDVDLVDQILVRDETGNEEHFRLFPGIRAGQVRTRVEKAGIGKMKEIYLNSCEENWDEYARLCKEVWPNTELKELPSIPEGVPQEMPGRIKFVVNSSYFQAIAKIGFHYFLAHSHRGFRGDELSFSDIRQFIMNGGNSDQFFKRQINRPTFAFPFGEIPGLGVATPSRWCHILAACESNGQAIAYVQLFVGPEHLPLPHYIWLGEWSSKVISMNPMWGHTYLYDQPQQKGRFAGRVVSLQVIPFFP